MRKTARLEGRFDRAGGSLRLTQNRLAIVFIVFQPSAPSRTPSHEVVVILTFGAWRIGAAMPSILPRHLATRSRPGD